MALGIVVALLVAVRAALPWALARVIEWQAPAQLGLPVRVGNIDLWLASGAVAIEDLVVGRQIARPAEAEAPPDPETALLRLQRLYVDLEWGDLFSHRIHLRELRLEAPAIRVERDAQGRIDPLGPPLPAQEPPPEAAPEEPSQPWSFALDRLELQSFGLRLVDLASQQTPVEFALAGLALSDVSLAGSEFGLGGIEIQNPVLRVDRDFALGGPAPAASAPGGPPTAAPPAPQPASEAALAYEIQRIAIHDAGFTLRTSSGPLDVSIRLDAEKVNGRAGETFPIDLALGLGEGKLALQGRVGLNPPRYDGRLLYSDLALPPLSVAARPELAEWVRSCRAGGDLAIEAHLTRIGDAPPGIRISGTVNVRDFRVEDPGAKEVAIGWKELEIVARELFVPLAAEDGASSATRVVLERVRLVDPDVRYTLPAPALAALLAGGHAPEQPAAPAADAAPEAAKPAAAEGAAGGGAPIQLQLDALEVTGGTLAFRNASVSPPVENRVRGLGLTAKDLRFPERRVKQLRANGIIPDAASFSLVGDLDGTTGDFRFALDRLALPPFSPYAAGAGYQLSRGDASVVTKIRLRGGRTDVDNQLVLHALDVSSADPGAFEKSFGIPVDLALALLRDPRGDISLEIPVVSDESGTRTEMGTIVRGALRQALVGALSSPLKLAGALLPGGGGAEASFAPLDAQAGSPELTPDAQARLGPLASLLGSRPALGLRLAGRVGPADRPHVAEAILIERAVAGEDWPKLADAGLLAPRRVRAALADRGRGESAELDAEDQVLLARYVAAVEVPPERMRDLARRRAEAARAALAASLGGDAGRLVVGDAAPEGDPAVLVELAAAPPAAAAP